ncbi:MAG: bifunctional phosphoribosylaminoimidazolecarboxamide formyltransferase/IMP cyclohydrolase [Streptococcaceae bacterium]|jgi:phosphoribosylaminoimidazolecarboxamide formyltransferase/IMP cyclohydrolase|nr:bifunctional phosphoribosylaminoimidazolecarboxamide formyltransferase/IMP cyclohydrolase [Streptococcaceae bacterium]
MKRALISVSDKNEVVKFARELTILGFEIISTGGTKVALEKADVPVIAVDEVTNFPEIMDGRVKTLHPKIHGGLLACLDLESHKKAMKDHDIQPIDLVCVNLYPFKETILKEDVSYEEAIENIDIGGPSMLRSAAKNHATVTVVVDPLDYAMVISELKENGDTTFATRQKLAAKIFRHISAYDALIAGYLTGLTKEKEVEKLTLTYDLKQTLRYGENPQQRAAFYQNALPISYSIAKGKQLHGKELSYNNIKDADAAIQIACEYEEPTVVALKHMNPCGIGVGKRIEKAWDYAYKADPVSIFGGVVVLNRKVDCATAKKMNQIFLEVIIASSFSNEAFKILTTKRKNLRLIQLDFSKKDESKNYPMITSVLGGVLLQNQDVIQENLKKWKVVTKKKPSKEELRALKFAWKAVKYVKSNAIVIANAKHTLGIGAGQMNRVGAVKIAVEQAKGKLNGAVLASDAFFPFADNVKEIARAKIQAIIQPGGSVRDKEVIEAADNYGMTMIFTNVRHFKH